MKVAIADDHHFIVKSIESTLTYSEGITLVGAYNDGQSLIKELDVIQPDVVVIDYHLPDMSGADISKYIKYHYPYIKIIVLTGIETPGLVTEMLENGCSGYLLKTTTNSEILIECINRVYEGNMYMDKSLNNIFAQQLYRRLDKNGPASPRLTKRELEVLKEIVNGLSSKEIGDILSISKRTVDNHRNSIMIKTESKNTVALIKFAIERKLIE